MRVPVVLLVLRQTGEEALGDDVLDADQVGCFGVPIKEHALEKVCVDLMAIMVSFHLLDGSRVLEEVSSSFQDRTLQGLRFTRWGEGPFSRFSHDTSVRNKSTNLAATS